MKGVCHGDSGMIEFGKHSFRFFLKDRALKSQISGILVYKTNGDAIPSVF